MFQAIESIFGMLMTDTGVYFPTYSIGAKHTSSIHGSIHLDSSLHQYSSEPVRLELLLIFYTLCTVVQRIVISTFFLIPLINVNLFKC